MPTAFSILERNILLKKGLTEENLASLAAIGVSGKADFLTVGDASTLCEVAPSISSEVAGSVMAWALGRLDSPGGENLPPAGTGGSVVLDTSDAVFCAHCKSKQPKDYTSGDLCVNCGKQAEPTETCYWCRATGPGKFCRSCGATFVATAELDLALILKKDGLPKDEIPKRLKEMSEPEKSQLWGRVRHSRQ